MSLLTRLNFIPVLLVPLLLGLSGPAAAEDAAARAFEDRIIQVLGDHMNLRSERRQLGEGTSEQAVTTIIQGEPNVALLANARIVGRDQEGKASQLAFSLTLIPDASVTTSPAKFLEWANQQNGQQMPAKVFLDYPRFGVMASRLIDLKYPMRDEEIVATYIYMMQTWRAMQQSLQQNQFM